jgi:hypothetical protein
MQYIMVAIHLDAKYIFVEPMQSRSNEEMIRAYKKIINMTSEIGRSLAQETHIRQQSH